MFELREGVRTADTDYGMALLDENSGQYWNLNPTATLIVRTMLDGGTLDTAAERLASAYHIDTVNAREDVEALVFELLGNGLVERPSRRARSHRTKGSTA